MPVLFTLLFKINIALVLFCLGYYLVLRHLTFYTLNRIYLVVAILFSSAYPFIKVDDFVQQHQQLTAPVQHVILQWKAPAENLVKPLNQPNYWQWAEVIFWTGVVLLAIRLIIQLFSLYRLYHNSRPGHVHNYPVRLLDGNVSPFSFWRSIFVNPESLSPADLEKVLEHEHVHVSEWHTLDILLAELSAIFYWFNPGIWLMKRAVRENVEFITDRKILQKGTDSKQYQYSLLNVSMSGVPNNLVNNFNISTIKKRIIMMNAKRSSRINLSRYILVAPIIILLLLVFSISKAGINKKSFFTNVINNIAVARADNAYDPPVIPEGKKLHKHHAESPAKKADTVYKGKSNDGKKTMTVISDKSKDSIGYVINGAKATSAEAKALDPGKVMSLDLISKAEAKKYVDFVIDKPELLFITTNDSEKGKSLKQRMDKDMGHGKLAGPPPPPAPGMSYSYSIRSDNKDAYSITSDNKDAAPEVSIDAPTAASADNVVIVGSPKAATKTIVIKRDVAVTAKPTVQTTITKTVDGVTTEEINSNIATIAPDDDVKYTYHIKAMTSDNDKSNVLFIVDGKEVKNISKVASSDIKSVKVLTDKDATSAYGEKGKNGVVVITTKKKGK